MFLTKAEQRELGKKEEKKAAESPYSFLADIKDVSCGYVKITETC
jgi:DNA mismatch repair protein MSH6